MRPFPPRAPHGLIVLFALTIALASCTRDTRPNVLLIVADDLRWDALGVNGHPFVATPNIDRIATEGIRFDQSFVLTSLCTPSRATLLTGLSPRQHGVRGLRDPLDPRIPTVARLLRNAGYRTGFVGKWHLAPDPRPQPGFDRWVSFPRQGVYESPVLNVDGARVEHPGAHATDVLTDYAVEFLTRTHDVPFFLILSHKAVHSPFTPQDRFRDRYASAEIRAPEPQEPGLPRQPAFLRCKAVDWSRLEPGLRRYYQTLTGLDDGVGRVLEALEERGLLDSTLVLFTSDNGYHWGEHGVAGKRSAYEESIRVPLFVRYPPWFPEGTVVPDRLALSLDLVPTILDAARVEAPAPLAGISLRRVARSRESRTSFLYEYDYDPLGGPMERCVPSIRAVRTLRFKWVSYPGSDETEELYDLARDPRERTNLIDRPDHAGTLEDLRSEMRRLRIASYGPPPDAD